MRKLKLRVRSNIQLILLQFVLTTEIICHTSDCDSASWETTDAAFTHNFFLAWNFPFFSPPVSYLTLLWNTFKFISSGRPLWLILQVDIISYPHLLKCIFHCGNLNLLVCVLQNSSLSPLLLKRYLCHKNAVYVGKKELLQEKTIFVSSATLFLCFEREHFNWPIIKPCL